VQTICTSAAHRAVVPCDSTAFLFYSAIMKVNQNRVWIILLKNGFPKVQWRQLISVVGISSSFDVKLSQDFTYGTKNH